MAWIAAIATVVGGALASRGGDRAADATEDAGDAAIQFQREALQAGINLARPSLEVGVSGPNSALGQLSSIFGLNTPSTIDFDGLSGSGGGVGAVQRAEQQGLTIIPGATWQNRPVYTDGNGGIYSVRGRDGTIERNGLSFLGQATEGNGVRFEGKPVKTGGGSVLDFRDGRFFAGRGERAPEIDVPPPQTQRGDVPQGEFTVGPGGEIRRRIPGPTGSPGGGPDLNELVTNNPLIQFTRSEGEDALARRFAGLGLSQSTPGIEEFLRFNNSLSSAGVQDLVVNPLFQLAGFGQQGASQLSNVAQNFGAGAANTALNVGNARASSFQNAGNIAGNTVSDIGNSIFLSNLLRNQPGRT